MTFAESQNIRPGGGTSRPLETAAPKAGTGGRPRFYLGAVAVLALIAWAALDSRPASQAPGLQAGPVASQPDAGPTFDGRGKWTGYAR